VSERPVEVADAGYAVAVVHYRSRPDLLRCLAGVAAQTVAPRHVYVYDADGEAETSRCVGERWPEVEVEAGPNRGYAGGANRALARIAERAPHCAYVLLLNPDVVLDGDFAEAMLAAVEPRPEVALACGRLRRPEPGVLDSAGIVLPAHRRPRDRGAGEPDRGQYARTEEVWGAGGAALWIRRAAARDLAVDGEVFDEDFFVYHEDTDLSWRARLYGWSNLYVAEAAATHGRAWRADRRFQVDVRVRRHSFKNHYLELIKNERGWRFWRDLPAIALFEGLRLAYALLRDPAVLPAYLDAWRLSARARARRRAIQEKAALRRGGVGRPASP
jgi:GT2 family glycosyltransferase